MSMRSKLGWLAVCGLAVIGLEACTPKATVKMEPIKIEPIHITVDVNIRVQKEIDNAFDYLYGSAPKPADGQ